MRPKLSQIRVVLGDAIAASLKEQGFVYRKADNKFIRKDKYGNSQIIILLYYHYSTSEEVEVIVGIKIKEIEDIYNKVLRKLGRKYGQYNDIRTLTLNIGNVIAYKDGVVAPPNETRIIYSIENDEDLTILSKVIPERIHEYVIPYFEENTSVNRVDILLNNNVKELSIHRLLYPLRASIGVIAAKLNKNPLLPSIINDYSSSIERANPEFKEDFENVVEEIKS